MKKLVLLTALALVMGVGVSANPILDYSLGLWGNAEGTAEMVVDDTPGEMSLYVVLQQAPGLSSQAVTFTAPTPPCFLATYLGETSAHVVAGDSQNGAIVIFDGGCTSEVKVLALTITYSVQGETGDCCFFPLQPYPATSSVERWDCSSTPAPIWSYSLVINPNADWCTTPVEKSTWGRIKAMYTL